MKTIHRARFKEIGEKGDAKLLGHTLSIVGLGSVGSQVAEALAREDFDLRLIDRGRVEEEDMGRLNIFQEEDITKFKVKQAKKRLELINPRIKIKSFHEELSSSNVFLIESELVIDATNQPEVNKLIFAHCQEKKIPLVYVRYSGGRIKLLVANKKIAQKDYDWLEDVGNVSKEGMYAGCAMFGAMMVINRIYKFFLGDNGSYHLQANAWEGDFKRTKL